MISIYITIIAKKLIDFFQKFCMRIKKPHSGHGMRLLKGQYKALSLTGSLTKERRQFYAFLICGSPSRLSRII